MRGQQRFVPMLAIVLAATAGAVTLLAQDSSPPHATTEPVDPPVVLPTDPTDIDRGRLLYGNHCASCHGPGGEGGKGPTLAQPVLARAQNDAELYRVIREGVGGTEMPRARMEKPDVARVAAFVKSLGTLPPEVVPGDPVRG